MRPRQGRVVQIVAPAATASPAGWWHTCVHTPHLGHSCSPCSRGVGGALDQPRARRQRWWPKATRAGSFWKLPRERGLRPRDREAGLTPHSTLLGLRHRLTCQVSGVSRYRLQQGRAHPSHTSRMCFAEWLGAWRLCGEPRSHSQAAGPTGWQRAALVGFGIL